MTDAAQLSQETIDAFVIAAHSDLDRVREMLAEEPNLLNQNASWIETALGAAAHTGSRAIADFLISQGAPVDICAAAMLGRAEDVEALLTEDPGLARATGAHDIPVLFHAAIGGHRDLIARLLAAGADINDGAGINPALHGAAGFGHTDLVRWLLEQGADFEALDFDGRAPLDVAELTGHESVASMLREYTGMR